MLEALHKSDTLLDDYPNRSVWTTWNISYEAILTTNNHVANLFVLWSFLDRNDLWHGLFKRALLRANIKEALHVEIGDIADDEISFIEAMSLLRSYSLTEGTQGSESYIMHTVVHHWIYFCQGMKHLSRLGQLALKVVGWAVPVSNGCDYARPQQRLLPHANVSPARFLMLDNVMLQNRDPDNELSPFCRKDLDGMENLGDLFYEVHNLGLLYKTQGKLAEVEKMFLRALAGKVAALGAEHTSTLDTINDLGMLYKNRGKLAEAEKMVLRARTGYKKTLGLQLVKTYIPALNTMCNLGDLYSTDQPQEARDMYGKALAGYTSVRGASGDVCIILRQRLERLTAK